MRIGIRSRAVGMVVAGVALVIGPFVVSSSAQEAELIGYLGVADSDAFAQTGGQQAAQGYPQAQTKTAHTFSSLDTGANGRALASSLWPGEFTGNLGSLLQVFGAPEEAGALNYPIRAEASTAGPAEASQPGMSARVEGPLAEATASSDGYDGDGSEFLTFGDIASVSRSELIEGTVVVTATAVVTDIDIGGGAITIESVKTTAIARTDGTTGTSEGTAVVSGVEIGGQPARVDENGIRAGDGTSENPANAVAQTVIDDVLSNFADAFQVEIYVSKPLHTDAGSIQEYRSGSLIVKLGLGDPQGDGGDGVIAIGGSNAYAQATSGLPFTATPLPPATAAPFESSPAATPLDTSGATSGPVFSDGTPTTAPAVDTAPDEIATAPALETVPIVDRFSGLGFGTPLIVLLGGLLVGRGLQRFHAAVNQPSVAACLIDGEDP